MKKFRAVLVAAVLTSLVGGTACFGQFALVRKVWTWNDSLGNKFVKTLVFWAFSIIPVYELSAFIDTFILNLIEFWSGSNPVGTAMKDGQTIDRFVDVQGKSVKLTYSNRGHDIAWELNGKAYRFHLDAQRAELRDGSGILLAGSSMSDEGAVEVRDGQGNTVLRRDASHVESLAKLMTAGPEIFAQQLDVERGTRVAQAK